MLEGKRPHGRLRTDYDCERARLRWAQGDAQFACIGIKPPQRDQRRTVLGTVLGLYRDGRFDWIEDIGDGDSGRDVEGQLAQLALGGPDEYIMSAFDHA